jgi:hypothetical protein
MRHAFTILYVCYCALFLIHSPLMVGVVAKGLNIKVYARLFSEANSLWDYFLIIIFNMPCHFISILPPEPLPEPRICYMYNYRSTHTSAHSGMAAHMVPSSLMFVCLRYIFSVIFFTMFHYFSHFSGFFMLEWKR